MADRTPTLTVESASADAVPVRTITSDDLRRLGQSLSSQFDRYKADRTVAEQKWLRALRQYLGIYDETVRAQLPADRSQAYPRITRVKVLSVLSRLMNLMFPGNEKNWELTASPSPDIEPQEVMQALQEMMEKDQQAGAEPRPVTRETVRRAVQRIADERAGELSLEIEDQLQEIGGDQTMDYISLVRAVVRSGIIYGGGLLEGPYAREATMTVWDIGEDGQPLVESRQTFRPVFEFLPVWDFFPDMAAKSLTEMDGYFTRKVMTRSQLRKLGSRPDFFKAQIDSYLRTNTEGNHKAMSFETELRSMGIKSEMQTQSPSASRYDVIIWHGNVSGDLLHQAGVEVPSGKRAEDIEAEVWMVGDRVIKADMNPWRKLGIEMRTIHPFIFDEDDTSPVGNGLPAIMRDSQMSICAATRMLLDNASVVCGPNVEVNVDVLLPNQDVSSVTAYKIWQREGTGAEAQVPAVRNIAIDAHMTELLQIVELFMRFADQETFVGPGSGGEMQQRGVSEPMRTAAGASMLRADAALPFKDVVRNFDSFTQSVILALVEFNRVFNPRVRPGDYNVIARGATSLIAKEVRGMQVDQLAVSMSPEERMHVDERKFIETRFAVRDLQGLMVSPDEAERRKAAGEQRVQQQMEQQQKMLEAQLRVALSDALKNVALAQKSSASADATSVKAVLDVLERGLGNGGIGQEGEGSAAAGPAAGQQPGNASLQGMADFVA